MSVKFVSVYRFDIHAVFIKSMHLIDVSQSYEVVSTERQYLTLTCVTDDKLKDVAPFFPDDFINMCLCK